MIENTSTWEGSLYQSDWVKINSGWIFFFFYFKCITIIVSELFCRLLHQRSRFRILSKVWVLTCPSLSRPMAERFCVQKLLDGESQAQSPVALVDLAVRSFSPNRRKYGLGCLRKTPMEGTPPIGLGRTSGQLALNLQQQQSLILNEYNFIEKLENYQVYTVNIFSD